MLHVDHRFPVVEQSDGQTQHVAQLPKIPARNNGAGAAKASGETRIARLVDSLNHQVHHAHKIARPERRQRNRHSISEKNRSARKTFVPPCSARPVAGADQGNVHGLFYRPQGNHCTRFKYP